LKRRAEADLRAHPSLKQMKQTSGMYTEIEMVKSDSAESDSSPADTKNIDAVKLNGSEWQESVQRLAAQFDGQDIVGQAPRLPNRGLAAGAAALQLRNLSRAEQANTHASTARRDAWAQIKTGVLSPLREDEGHYYAVAVMNKGKDRLKLATVAWLKEPLRSWLAKAEALVPVTMAALTANYTLPAIASPSGGCTDDTWAPTNTINAPAGRYFHTAVWTGSEMIVWGGIGASNYLNTGGRYNPSTDSWTATSTTGAPGARFVHTAVWTGSEMIVWGGYIGGLALNTGSKYNPTTDTWTAT